VPSPADTRLTQLPAAAVAFALGVCVGRQQNAQTAGQLSALIGELRRRGIYDDMVATLDPTLRRSLQLMETVDRGQAWNRGRR
jgi:hypothetical protein